MDHERTSHPSTVRSPGMEHSVSQPDHGIQVMASTAGDNYGASESGSPHSGSTAERRLFGPSEFPSNSDSYTTDIERGIPVLPPRSVHSRDGRVSQRRTLGFSATGTPMAAQPPDPDLGYLVPHFTMTPSNHPKTDQSLIVNEKGTQTEKKGRTWLSWLLSPCCRRNKRPEVKTAEKSLSSGSIGERLAPTIRYAEEEKEKYARKALVLGWAVNIAIGLQVLLGALTTALATAVTSAKQAQVSTAILGGLSTLVASYLARVRGSGEPELSVLRVKDLEHFIRDCKAFELDDGNKCSTGHPHCHLNKRLMELRQKFENLLGDANGERKLSATGISTADTTGTSAGNPARAR